MTPSRTSKLKKEIENLKKFIPYSEMSIDNWEIPKARLEERNLCLKEELEILLSILNSNDRFRIGEIEQRISAIKKELSQ